MLLSVLLPTHDRLDYLKFAVQSVLRQDDGDWELVVSDNASADDIAGYLGEIGDDRIRYVKTERFVPVTENWNNALRHSRGDYVVMLGDDDALLPGYVAALRGIRDRFSEPDVLYTGAMLFTYPGVLEDVPTGRLEPYSYAPFFTGAHEPFALAPDEARGLVRDAMDFRVRYGFNMQYVAVRRSVVETLAADGDFYRSPFPDYFAMNLLFMLAERIVVDPEPRVVIGVTKSSYGFFHVNRREDEAMALLNNEATDPEIRDQLASVLLPGTNINTGWLLAVEALYRRLGRPAGLRPNYTRYRRLQALHCEQGYYVHRTVSRADLRRAEAGLRPRERWVFRLLGPGVGAILRTTPTGPRQRLGAIYDRLVGQFQPVAESVAAARSYRNMLEVFEDLDARASAGVAR